MKATRTKSFKHDNGWLTIDRLDHPIGVSYVVTVCIRDDMRTYQLGDVSEMTSLARAAMLTDSVLLEKNLPVIKWDGEGY